MKKLLIAFTVALLSVGASAEQWSLNVSYSSTNALGVTEIRGESDSGAAVSAQDANGTALICFPFLGIVGEDGKFNCWGRDLVAPVSITAQNSILSQFSENTSNTVAVEELNDNGQAWPLTVNEPQTSFFGLTEVSGESLEGAAISAVDANGANLFCLPFLGTVGADNKFTCFGLGVALPITVNVTTSAATVLSDYIDASAVVGESTEEEVAPAPEV